MRIIITLALLLAISIGAKAQRIVPIANGRVTDTGYIIGSLKVDSVLVFPNYRTTNTNMVLGFDSRGKAVLRINNDSLIYATRRYVDSGFNAITAGSVDSSIYTTVTRLADSLRGLRDYVDSNNTIIYGSITALYDTLPNYVDTAQLNDSLQAIKAAYVPYVGATSDLNLGTHNILPNSVRLSTSPTGTLTNVGQLYWDATNVTPAIPLNANVTLQIGQEEHVRAVNKTGVQINDGQVVYINDAQGNNPTIALANSDSVNTSEVIGVATENIADNGTGFVTTFGIVNGFNTSSFTSGDILYLNTVSGQLSNTIPTPPHNVVKVGIALNSTNNGNIFVQPSAPLGQDTTFAAPYNSDKVAPTQRSIGTYVRKIVRDTASALRTAINAKYGTSDTGRAAANIVTGGGLNKVRDSLNTLIAAKGSGSVTSITGGYGLTGGTITTTGTFAVDSNLQATRARVQKAIDSLNVVKGNGTVTSIQLVGGTNVTITPTTAITTSGVYTISATGGGGSPTTTVNYKVLYKSGDSIKAASKVNIDTTDGRMVLEQNTDTSSVSAFYGGGTKIVGRNRMGMSSLALIDSVSIPAALQRAINVQLTSTIEPLATNTATYTGAFSLSTPAAARPTFVAGGGAATTRIASYNATQQHLNYNVLLFTTSASAGQIAGMYMTANTHLAGIICGNTKNSGGGGRGTFMFGLPTFAIGHRLFVGYTTNFTNSAADPSSFTSSAMIGLAKDAADATLQIMHSSGGGTVTKVSTGLTASTDDLYIVTVYIAPNSTFYIQVEVRGKTSTKTFVYNPTTNVPAVGTRLEMRQLAGTGLSGGVTEFGFIKFTEEIY